MTFAEENPVFEFEMMNLPSECLFDSDIRESKKIKTPEIEGVKPELYLEELFSLLGVQMPEKNVILIVEKPLDSSSKVIRKLLPVKFWTKNKINRRRNNEEVYKSLSTGNEVFDCGDFYEIYAVYESDAKQTLKKFMEKNHGQNF